MKTGFILLFLLIGTVIAAAFDSAAPLAQGRFDHTAVRLKDGKVLVAGGNGTYDYNARVAPVLNSSEIYDPASGTWRSTNGAMLQARTGHTATLLADGRVLVAGGGDLNGFLASAEIYDPSTMRWSVTGSLGAARYVYTATLLKTGKVLVVGGFNSNGLVSTAELYDPFAGTWSPTTSPAIARFEHTATLLPNGKVLISGGSGANGADIRAACELYDPATESWSTTGSLADARYAHTATLLSDGKVLVTGGFNSAKGYLTSTELYDPVKGTWTVRGPLNNARYYHTATLLLDGRVLVAGGYFGQPIASAEVYDPAAGTWSVVSPLMTARWEHTATLLNTGKVLIVGGRDSSPQGLALASVELSDRPTTILVTSRGDSHVEGQISLREAIAMSLSGDTVTFGVDGPINLEQGAINIVHNLVVQGPSGRTERVVGNLQSRIFTVTGGDVTLANLGMEKGSMTGSSATASTPATDGLGGAVYNTSALHINDCEFYDDFAHGGAGAAGTTAAGVGRGGAIYNAGTLNAARCLFYLNQATGGLDSPGAVGAEGTGGAIYNAGTAVVANCTFFSNVAKGAIPATSVAKGGSGKGGAVYNAGSLTVTNSTIYKNYADGSPGYSPSTPGGDGFGGGVFVAANATGQTTIGSTIVWGNLARGGGIYPQQGASVGPDVYGNVNSLGYNFVGSPEANNGWLASDQVPGGYLSIHTLPLNNGGATRTLALRPGSAAIDHGRSFGVASDQRGLARTYDDPASPNSNGGDGTDVGAFELQPAPPSLLLNLSTRADSGAGDNVVIGGVLITGNAPKKLLFHAGSIAAGSSYLADPTLELYASDGHLVATNDNWGDTQAQDVIDVGIGYPAPHDAAIVLSVDPGPYTAVLRGKNGTTGIALLEIYDLNSYTDSHLANLSTRAYVGTDDRTAIAGLIIGGGGGGMTKVLVRVLGPSLSTYNLDYVADPLVELHDADGTEIASNDNWKDTQESEIAATGIAPGYAEECAIVANLLPGRYTAVTRSHAKSGIGLVEVYNLQ